MPLLLPLHELECALQGSFVRAGTAGFGRRDALEALLTFELDFQSSDFTSLSSEAQDFVKVTSLMTSSTMERSDQCLCTWFLSSKFRERSHCGGVVQSLLQKDPRKRLKAEDALRHSWLQLESAQHASDEPLGSSIVQRLQRFHTYNKFKQVCSIRQDTQLGPVMQLFHVPKG